MKTLLSILFIIFIVIVNVNGFDLQPVSVGQTITNDFTITSVPNQQALTISLSPLNDIGQDSLEKISKELYLMIDMCGTTARYMKWDFSINQKFGLLKLYNIVAHISGQTIKIESKYLSLEQAVPTMYNLEQKCARTGPRRYGISGPRGMECYHISVVRGLNGNEIQIVNDRLTGKAKELQLAITN